MARRPNSRDNSSNHRSCMRNNFTAFKTVVVKSIYEAVPFSIKQKKWNSVGLPALKNSFRTSI